MIIKISNLRTSTLALLAVLAAAIRKQVDEAEKQTENPCTP